MSADFKHPFHTDESPTPLTRIVIPVVVTEYQAWCQLTAAFEGGSNYWIDRVEVVGKRPAKTEFIQDVPFLGGMLRVVLNDPSDAERGVWPLTRANIAAGLEIMARIAAHHFARVLDDGGDAETGDVFLQCCVLGEVMYG